LVAQLFTDYYGISLGMMLVFLAAFVFYRDKRSKIGELICSRSINGLVYVIGKYTGLCLSVFIGIMLIACIPTYYAIKMKLSGYDVDILTYFTTFSVWLLPVIMMIVSLGMFISLIFNNPIPAFICQFIVFASSVMPLKGDYRLFKVFIRHNRLEKVQDIQALYTNRVFIILLALALVFITSFIWERKRVKIGEQIK
jgi:integral membrane sensor domain MASE1